MCAAALRPASAFKHPTRHVGLSADTKASPSSMNRRTSARLSDVARVAGVSLMEFGTPEAMWHLWVRDFPAIVTMDAHGNSLHKEIEEASAAKLTPVAR